MTETQAGLPGPQPSHGISSLFSRLSGYVANAIRFWEPCRLLYNGLLLLLFVVEFVVALPKSQGQLSLNFFLLMFFLAVLANVCYCTVYLVDLFVQFAGLQRPWRVARWVLFGVGVAFASTITHFFLYGIFSSK